MSFIIAIDGPAGSGKGTVTKLLATKLNFLTMDTGAMYRCVTLYLINNKINISNEYLVKESLEKIEIDLREVDKIQRFFLNGKDVSKEIREKEVDRLVSQVSHIPCVRKAMVDLQRKLASGKNIIMEGRDIGTNVFPNADIKIYLDATAEERARRRFEQNKQNGISNISYEEILENVRFRDNNDKTSSVAPLKKAEDAIAIDSTNMSIDEVVEEIRKLAINIK